MKLAAGRAALFVVGFYLLSGGAQAQTITSLTLSPSSIAGGSGGSSTGTVTLSAPAPVGGTVVKLSSSNTDLAASVPSLTVPQGATSATFTVGTNALYRRYSGLSFTVTISASVNASTASTTLTVTAQARPPDITGDSCQREGFVCGGAFPAGQGEPGILYQCFVALTCNGMNGTCTFRQECSLGCRTNPPDGFKFSDACAITTPFPVSLNPKFLVGGNSSAGAIQLDAPAPDGSVAGAATNSVFATLSPVDPLPAGATSAGFTVSTEPVAVPNFAGISGVYVTPEPDPQGGTFFRRRLGLAWLSFVPPPGDPPAAVSTFTLNPTTVVAGAASQATITLTKAAPAGGAIVKLGADVPAVVSLPFSVTVPAGAASTTFPVCSLNGPASASIAAAYGGVIKKATITTTAPPSLTISSLTLSPSTVVGGNSSTATVTLSGPAPCSGASIYPSSSSLAASVPGIVDVQPGATSASFAVTTAQVTATTAVTISLFFGGTTTSATLVVTPPGGGSPVVTSLTLNPSSVVGGSSSTGTVTLSAAAPAGGAVVSLGTTNSAVATPPPSVTVPQGATSASFTVTTSSVTTSTGVSIWASFGTVTLTAALTVNPATPSDTVAIQLAQYDVAKTQLLVQASSTSASATLKVYVTATGALIGTLTNKGGGKYEGQFSWPSNPSNIRVRSSLGGSATSAVTAK